MTQGTGGIISLTLDSTPGYRSVNPSGSGDAARGRPWRTAKNRIAHLAARGAVFMLAALPCAARACDQCMGGKDPTIRPAVNGAIFFMLGLVALMATGMGFFMRYLAKRANAPLAPHVELMMTMPEGPNHV